MSLGSDPVIVEEIEPASSEKSSNDDEPHTLTVCDTESTIAPLQVLIIIIYFVSIVLADIFE